MAWQRIARISKTLLKFGVILLIAGFLFYRQRLSPVPVQAVPVDRGTVVSEVLGTGTLDAHTQATVSPKIQGRLVKLTVDQNDRVTTGQLLARLDDSDLKEQVAMAQAGLEAAQASLERVRTDKKRAEAVVEMASLDYGRYSKLKTSESVSVSEVDKTREVLRVSQADDARSAAAITEFEKQVVSAEKSLLYQKARLADAEILSPLGGLIIRRDRNEGDIVVPGASIFQLISTDDLWVSAWVDETAMSNLHVGQSARVVFRSEQEKAYPGSVARVGHEVDRETREFLVDVRVNDLPANWAIGQRAEVYIETDRKENALRLPARVIVWKEQKPGVFVMQGDKAAWRDLTLGIQDETHVEVVKGLAEGDVAITALPQDPKMPTPGRRVKVAPAP
jgi:HlyD family secretion protein